MTTLRDQGDAQELLLGGLDESGARRARRALTWTRLVVQDLEARRTADSPVDLKAAREQLRSIGRRRAWAAAEALLASLLSRSLGDETHVCLGPRERSPAAWWAELLTSRETKAATFPDPAAEPRVVGEALVSFLESAGAPRAPLWRARWLWFERGPRGVERALGGLLRGEPRGLDPVSLRCEVAAWMLERGAVDELEAWLPMCGDGEHARRLRAWCGVMRSDARPTDPAPACSGCPRPLAAGRALAAEAVGERVLSGTHLRYAVLALAGDGVVCLAVRGTSATRAAVESARASEAVRRDERELRHSARPLAVRGPAAAGRACLGSARALALEPVLAAGRVAGWVRFESPTPWLPNTRDRALVRERWKTAVLEAYHAAPMRRRDAGEPRAHTRRWLASWSARLRLRSADTTLLVRRGAELRPWLAEPAETAPLPTSVKDLERSWIDERGRPTASGDRAAGFSLPLVHEEEVLGAWVVRGDTSTLLRAETHPPVAGMSAQFRAAHFCDWHEARFASPVAFDGHSLRALWRVRCEGGELPELRAEAGVDTVRVARWLAFEREFGDRSPSPAAAPHALRVPPLRARREEVAERVLWNLRLLRGGFGGPPARWSDDLAAWFWRQTWRGNEDELDRYCRSYLERLLEAPDPVGAARRTAREFGFESVERIPTDAASSAADLEAALRATASSSGKPNKSRASRYLGWSAATVRARLRRSRPGDGRSAPNRPR